MSSTPTSPSPSLARWLPWFLAVVAGLGAFFFGLQAATARQEAEALRLQLDLRELELRDARNHSAAERIILQGQIETGRSPAVAAPPGAATKN